MATLEDASARPTRGTIAAAIVPSDRMDAEEATMEQKSANRQSAAPETPYRPLPEGYRQGIITAITVLLGFSLALFRFWGFEAPGEWTSRSIVAAGTIVFAVLLQIVALVRSLRLEDDDPAEYRKTVNWFATSAVALLIGLLVATVVFAGTPISK